jgi:hypothetical protein
MMPFQYFFQVRPGASELFGQNTKFRGVRDHRPSVTRPVRQRGYDLSFRKRWRGNRFLLRLLYSLPLRFQIRVDWDSRRDTDEGGVPRKISLPGSDCGRSPEPGKCQHSRAQRK